MEAKKQAICDALRAWIEQRPGLDPANYFCGGNWQENRRNYDGERRRIHRQLKDARELLRAVEWRDSITADDMLAAFPRAFSGRLSCKVEPVYTSGKVAVIPGHVTRYAVKLDYCTGQYWPTEYRAAAAAVLASILWDRKRRDMPETLPTNDGRRTVYGSDLNPGAWLRASFRREFGATMQRRYFD